MNLATRGLGRSRQLLATGGIGRVVLIVLRGGGSSRRRRQPITHGNKNQAFLEDEEFIAVLQAFLNHTKH